MSIKLEAICDRELARVGLADRDDTDRMVTKAAYKVMDKLQQGIGQQEAVAQVCKEMNLGQG